MSLFSRYKAGPYLPHSPSRLSTRSDNVCTFKEEYAPYNLQKRVYIIVFSFLDFIRKTSTQSRQINQLLEMVWMQSLLKAALKWSITDTKWSIILQMPDLSLEISFIPISMYKFVVIAEKPSSISSLMVKCKDPRLWPVHPIRCWKVLYYCPSKGEHMSIIHLAVCLK